MKKQKICIIGGNLTGLVTAIALSKLNCDIDLITGNNKLNPSINRTIAISENNLDYLNKLNIHKSLKNEAWACSKMKLYTEIKKKKNSEVFQLDNNEKGKKVLYMIENSKMIKLMINKIKKNHSISIKNNVKINEIFNSGLLKSIKINNTKFKYNLIIICTGSSSNLVKNIFKEPLIENSYEETSITTTLNHNLLENNVARQFFLHNGILALLPISNNKTSIVWSIRGNVKKNDLYLKRKIKFYVEQYIKNAKFINKIEYKNLKLLIRSKYYQDRILLFGDALHIIHPFIGQGFNMTLRDLACLEKILAQNINLGLDVGSSNILSEFSNETKPRNFAFSVGSDILKNSFAFQEPRNSILKIINRSNFAKDVLFNIADKGFRF
tara:strand:- start:886 stop:2031 length:1146 start_codon:yes stop_codon:yes gene_type:complete